MSASHKNLLRKVTINSMQSYLILTRPSLSIFIAVVDSPGSIL